MPDISVCLIYYNASGITCRLIRCICACNIVCVLGLTTDLRRSLNGYGAWRRRLHRDETVVNTRGRQRCSTTDRHHYDNVMFGSVLLRGDHKGNTFIQIQTRFKIDNSIIDGIIRLLNAIFIFQKKISNKCITIITFFKKSSII